MPKRDRDAEGRPSYAGPRDRHGRPQPRGSADAPEHRADLPEAVDDAICLGADLFDRQQFFEAHELFEHVWKSSEIAAEEREFWKAVTQVCVGFCHVQRGNVKGARSVLARAVGVLEGDRNDHRSVDGRTLAAAASDVASRITADADVGTVRFPRFPIARR